MVIIVNETTTNVSEEQPIPLFHQPLVIDGKRVRKPVSRFASSNETAPKPALSGNGTALGDLQTVKQKLGELADGGIKTFHKFLFGNVGKKSTNLDEIEEFNGFPFAIDTNEYKKKRTSLKRMSIENFEMITEIIGLELDATAEEIMEFLMMPKQHAAKRRSSDSDDNPTPKKKSPQTDAQAASSLRLSESSNDSDGEMDMPVLEAEAERNTPQATKQKKQVTFEDMVRMEQGEQGATDGGNDLQQ